MLYNLFGYTKIMSQIDKLIDTTPRQLMYKKYRKLIKCEILQEFDSNHPCVFVLSTGRVGTQTMAELFRLDRGVFSYHEPMPKLYGLSKLSYENSDVQVQKILHEAFLVSRRVLLNTSLSCLKGYIETSPQVTFLAPYIMNAIPNVKFIHLVRDPRKVVLSGIRRNWYNGNPFDEGRIVPHPNSTIGKNWHLYSLLQKNLWLWFETNQWILNFSSTLSEDRLLMIHSEDIFSTNEDIIKKVFSFIDSPTPPMKKILHVLSKKFNAQQTGVCSTPPNWSEVIPHEMRNDLNKMLEVLGYKI
jgi:hypothetical protein